MTSPVSAIEAIEKAMQGLRNAPGPWEVESEKQDDLSPKHDEFALHNADGYRMCGTENADWRFSEIVTDGPDEDGFFSDWNDPAERLMKYVASCNPVAMREVLAVARQAEALQRENAELREALKPFADLAGRYDGMPAPKYFGDTDFEMRYSGETKASVTVASLRRARALLGGENAE